MNRFFTKKVTLQNIEQKIVQYGVQPMDVIVIRAKKGAVLDHYVVFLGYDSTTLEPLFIANYPSPHSKNNTVQFVPWEDLVHYSGKMDVSRIRAFQGTNDEREFARERALMCVNSRTYDYVFNNCEHFANYVQYGKAYSQQTLIASFSAFLFFVLLLFASKDKRFKAVGGTMAGLSILVLGLELSNVNTFKSPKAIQQMA